MTGPVQRVRAFDRRHPSCWDLAVAIALTAISIKATERLDPLGIALLSVVNGAVVLRRRKPGLALLAALACVVSAVVVSTLTDLRPSWIYLAMWVLLFNVGLRHGSRRIAGLAVAVGLTGLAAFIAPVDGMAVEIVERVRSSLTVAAMCAASLLVGVQLNSQREALVGQRQEAARAAVISERSRIAQEMHDIIGHNLSVITSLANGGAVAVRTSPRDAERAFDAIGEVSRSSVREVRRVLAVLRYDRSPDGASLSPQPGLDDVTALVESVRAAGAQVTVERVGDLGSLSAGRQLAVYRIVQESLTNVLRHAGHRARVSITIAHEDGGLTVLVDDSGAARTGEQRDDVAEPGHGILGMRERAEAYGGTVDARTTGSGWRVRARIPVEQMHEQ
jgi:signal transduction histidine kinase